MTAIIQSFLSGSSLTMILAVFCCISIVLNAVGQGFQAFGKTAPGWIGTVSGYIGSIVHFINGNIPAPAPLPVPAAAPIAPPQA